MLGFVSPFASRVSRSIRASKAAQDRAQILKHTSTSVEHSFSADAIKQGVCGRPAADLRPVGRRLRCGLYPVSCDGRCFQGFGDVFRIAARIRLGNIGVDHGERG